MIGVCAWRMSSQMPLQHLQEESSLYMYNFGENLCVCSCLWNFKIGHILNTFFPTDLVPNKTHLRGNKKKIKIFGIQPTLGFRCRYNKSKRWKTTNLVFFLCNVSWTFYIILNHLTLPSIFFSFFFCWWHNVRSIKKFFLI